MNLPEALRALADIIERNGLVLPSEITEQRMVKVSKTKSQRLAEMRRRNRNIALKVLYGSKNN